MRAGLLFLLLLGLCGGAQAQSLLETARNGNASHAMALVLDGADVRQQGPQGDTPLHWAAFNGQSPLARALLERGAEVDAQVSNGNTPLHLAAYAGHLDMVKLLLDANARPHIRNAQNLTPAQWAARNGHPQVVALLEPGARPAPASEMGAPQRSLVLIPRDDDAALLAGARISQRMGILRPHKRSTAPAAPETGTRVETVTPPMADTRAEPVISPTAVIKVEALPPPVADTEVQAPAVPETKAVAVPRPTPEVETVAMAEPAPEAEPEAWIQFGAFDSNAMARRHWSHLQRQARGQLDGVEPVVQVATIAGQEFHRLRIGPLPHSRAQRDCESLFTHEIVCMVILRNAPR